MPSLSRGIPWRIYPEAHWTANSVSYAEGRPAAQCRSERAARRRCARREVCEQQCLRAAYPTARPGPRTEHTPVRAGQFVRSLQWTPCRSALVTRRTADQPLRNLRPRDARHVDTHHPLRPAMGHHNAPIAGHHGTFQGNNAACHAGPADVTERRVMTSVPAISPSIATLNTFDSPDPQVALERTGTEAQSTTLC